MPSPWRWALGCLAPTTEYLVRFGRFSQPAFLSRVIRLFVFVICNLIDFSLAYLFKTCEFENLITLIRRQTNLVSGQVWKAKNVPPTSLDLQAPARAAASPLLLFLPPLLFPLLQQRNERPSETSRFQSAFPSCAGTAIYFLLDLWTARSCFRTLGQPKYQLKISYPKMHFRAHQ